MNIQQDFKELLALLEKHRVEYMIVGGYAVAFHGYPRYTKDLDIFFRSSRDNVGRIIEALCEFGFPREQLPPDSFVQEGNIVTFGVAPLRVDLLNRIDGVSYDEAEPRVSRGRYGGLEVCFIGKQDLLKNKTSTPRLQDKADAEKLS